MNNGFGGFLNSKMYVMKVIVYNFSALNDFQVNEGTGILREGSLTRLPGVNIREITIMSTTESVTGISGKDSVFL